MKLFEIVFSPTGGTKKVCEVLSNEFQGEKIKINLMNMNSSNSKEEIKPDNICLIAVPSFGGRVPAPAVERLKKVKGNAASAEHSIMHQFGSGRPDEQDKEELRKYAVQIFHMLSGGQTFGALSVPGKRPYREYKGLPLHPNAGKSCNGCGVCVNVCPVGAIRKDNPRETDNEKCITCMGCVAACPKNVRKLSPILLAVASNKMKKACSVRKENELIMEVHS